MNKYKFHIVRPYKSATLDVPATPRDEKDVVMSGPSCCEAAVLVLKKHRDYEIVSWTAIEQ